MGAKKRHKKLQKKLRKAAEQLAATIRNNQMVTVRYRKGGDSTGTSIGVALCQPEKVMSEDSIARAGRAIDDLIKRRNEPEIDWSQIPESVRWIAKDKSGKTFGYLGEPHTAGEFWIGPTIGVLAYITIPGDLKESLRQRPEKVEPEKPEPKEGEWWLCYNDKCRETIHLLKNDSWCWHQEYPVLDCTVTPICKMVRADEQ